MFFIPYEKREQRLERLYSFSRLGPFSERRADNLSGGMYKKLALMCNMIHSPRLLILDEPTTGVDPLSRRELWEIIYTMVEEENIAIVVNTPYMDEAERCHRVGMMWEGTFPVIDSPEAILKNHPEEIYEFRCENREEALKQLKSVSGISHSYAIGQEIRAAFDRSVKGEDALLRLRQAGIAGDSIQKTAPTFDDVFMAFREESR